MQLYYQDNRSTLYLADGHDLARRLSGIDLVLTDPPWGINWDTRYAQRSRSTVSCAQRRNWQPIAGDDAPFDPSPWLDYPQVVLWGANCFSDRLPLGTWLIWDKRFASGRTFKNSDGDAGWKKGGHGVKIFSQTWQGCMRAKRHASERVLTHPTQKSVALGRWSILQMSPAPHNVFDPYCGSGAFIIAAKSLGLYATGADTEEQYLEAAARRLQATEAGELPERGVKTPPRWALQFAQPSATEHAQHRQLDLFTY